MVSEPRVRGRAKDTVQCVTAARRRMAGSADWAHRCHICTGTGLTRCHICTGTNHSGAGEAAESFVWVNPMDSLGMAPIETEPVGLSIIIMRTLSCIITSAT